MNTETLPNKAFFFDDDDQTIRFEFKKGDKAQNKDLNHPYTIQSILIRQSPYSLAQETGYYALHNKTLVWYKSSSVKVSEGVLDLSHCRLKELEPTEECNYNGFSVSKNENTYMFYALNKELANEWMEALKPICVLTNFHEEYKAAKMIGRGSFAKVYLVEAKSTGKSYAVKAFTKESIYASNKNNARISMLNEIEIMRELDHENIIKLYEVHESEKSIYLVLELIQGKSLQEVLKKTTFKEEYSTVKIHNMIRSILDALAYLASKGIMHRDLKPDNILLDKDGKIKIADFGLATHIDEAEYIYKKCGTPGYIAPEVFKYDHNNPLTDYDYQCDVFSAGCIFFYMLFGHPFFEAANASEILRSNRKFAPEFEMMTKIKFELHRPKPEISKDGLDLLLQLLEFNPKRRTMAAEALIHPYFVPIPSGMHKLASSQDFVQESGSRRGSSLQSLKMVIPLSPKHMVVDQICMSPAGTDSPKSPMFLKERFAQKDSLYLDIGKPELNGRLDTLNAATMTSRNNSLLIQKRPSNANIGSGHTHETPHASAFAKNAMAKKSKSFKIHTNTNQSFLKAALLRNMQKNTNEAAGEEAKDELPSPPMLLERTVSDKAQNRYTFYSSRNSSQSQDNDSEDEVIESPKKLGAITMRREGSVGRQILVKAKKRFQPFENKMVKAIAK